ncbi:MAG: AcrB/AcrD/AcrF family protein [Candidatus Hydrogenedens sp.]|nr:AcrB/AcrD/AcrF family protein [Candidatus Hydrogenedens sp.]
MSEPSAPEQLDPQRYRLAIRRPVTMAMLFLTIIVFGWRSYQQLPVNLMPDISYPTLTVRTEYEGAAPEDVEKLVTRPLEEFLSIVSGMVQISSISSPGLSEIVLEFTWSTDMNVAQQDVRDRIDLFSAPEGVTEKPVILRYDPTLDPVIRVAITAPPIDNSDGAATPAEIMKLERVQLTAIRDAAERHLKSDLEAKNGIAQVQLKGGQEEEIQILVDAQKIKNLGLTLENLSQSLAQQNINLSGGRLQEGRTEYLVRTLNEFQSVDEIGDSIISTPAGAQFRLRDVADVFMGTKERESVVRINGREAVALDIYKEGDANTVEVCSEVKELLGFERELGPVEKLQQQIMARMKQKQADGGNTGAASDAPVDTKPDNLLDRLPPGIHQTLISDQSRFIVGAIDEVQNATLMGGLLALIVLFLFLKELKSTMIIGVAIPISVIATFVPMYMGGIFGDVISLNIMSLGGLALGVGMLVDNSIVVLESVFRCREEGDGVLDAAERGTSEVASAVTASTLTTVAVFFPIAFVEGIAGQIFGDLALTVTFSLLASLLTALYLIPLVVSRRSVAVHADRQVIWMLRAYRENRDEKGMGMAGAVLAAPANALRYVWDYLRESSGDTFGPSLRAARGMVASRSVGGVVGGLFGIVSLPLLLPVYLLQLVLKLAQAIFVTALFVIVALLGLAWFVAGKVFWVILWLPLRIFDFFFEGFREGYRILLTHSLRFSPIILLAMTAISAHAFYTATELGSELIPPMQQGEFGIRMEARPGTRLEETEERASRIESLVLQRDDIDTVTVEIGQEDTSSSEDRGENIAQFTVLLKNPEENAERQGTIIDELREKIIQFATSEISFTLPSMFSFKTAIELQLVGEDLNILRDVGGLALAEVQKIPGVEDAELSVKPGYPEVVIELDRELLAAKGITSGQVAQRLRAEVQGDVPTQFSSYGEKIPIRVRTDQRFLQSVEDLKKMSVSTGASPIPLEAVASIIVQEGPSEIRRIDQRQVVLITANVSGRDLGAVSNEILAAVETVPRPKDYYFLPGGQFRELETSYASLQFALALAIFLVYVVMACQFESVWHPVLVMFSVPLAFVGVIYALEYTHTDVSIMVFLGGIVLAGIVVNNAIVLVDYINQLRRRGYDMERAVVEAGQARLRPIIMTTVTTVLGLLPMLESTGDGSELRYPMAITVMSGLSCATILTLLVIPMAYYLFGKWGESEVTE